MGKGKKIYICGGTEEKHRWSLRFIISVEEHICEALFNLEPEKRKDNSRKMHLSGGREENHEWELFLNVSAKQHRWEGHFYLAEEKRKDIRRSLVLASGREEKWGWELKLNISANQQIWTGTYQVEDELRKYRHERRINDNNWANRTFPRSWKQQFEIHHSWIGGETCYFLTPEEHREQDRKIRYGLC